MSRYYRTSMGDDPVPVVAESTAARPAKKHRVPKHAPAGTSVAPAQGTTPPAPAPTTTARPSKSTGPHRPRTTLDRRPPLAITAADGTQARHRVLLIGGAVVGLGALLLLLTRDRRRRR
jgi:hypothetical protein